MRMEGGFAGLYIGELSQSAVALREGKWYATS